MRYKDKNKLEERKKKTYQFFIDKGLSPVHAAALTGNFLVESGLDTRIEGDKNLDHASVGLAQFRGDRLKRLRDKYEDPYTLDNQLDFVWWELNNTHKHALNDLVQTSTPEQAAVSVRKKYEVAIDKHDDRRIQESIGVLNSFFTTPSQNNRIDLANPIAQREEMVRESTYVDPKLTEKMINFVNRSQNSTFVTPPLPNIGEEKTENKETEKAKEVLEEKKNEERFIQDILSNKIQPINIQQPQQEQQTVQPFGSYILNRAKELGIFQEGGSAGNTPYTMPTGAKHKIISGLEEIEKFLGDTNGMYLDEDSRSYKMYNDREKYFNPKKIKNITSGDWKEDLLYENDWLFDTPIIGEIIRNKARDVAIKSGGNPTVNRNETVSREDRERGFGYGNYQYESSSKEFNKHTLLDQYFSKDKLFEYSKYKPTSDYLEFLPSYSIKGDFDTKIKQDDYLNSSFSDIIIDEIIRNDLKTNKNKDYSSKEKADELYDSFLKNKSTIYNNYNIDSKLSSMLGLNLAGHKVGMKWDEELDLPYISLSDAWDFEPEAYSKKWNNSFEEKGKSYIQSYLMHKSGNPFKVYDRFYFNPETKEYIPDSKIEGVRNR